MTANVEFNITAFDEASSVFEEVQSSASECFSAVTSSASEAASSVETSSSEMVSSTQNYQSALEEAQSQQENINASYGYTPLAVDSATTSLKSNALAIGQVASGAASLVMGLSGVENAQVALDRANVTVEKDTNAVQAATEKYNEAVAKYGPNSQQATDAADKHPLS
ncbi:MAG: hypothetical protein ABSE15_04270 [Candidatus Bathyarchaeia archaeon]|jgi:hypothetical protein